MFDDSVSIKTAVVVVDVVVVFVRRSSNCGSVCNCAASSKTCLMIQLL